MSDKSPKYSIADVAEKFSLDAKALKQLIMISADRPIPTCMPQGRVRNKLMKTGWCGETSKPTTYNRVGRYDLDEMIAFLRRHELIP